MRHAEDPRNVEACASALRAKAGLKPFPGLTADGKPVVALQAAIDEGEDIIRRAAESRRRGRAWRLMERTLDAQERERDGNGG